MNYKSVFLAAIQAVGLFISGFFIPVLGQMLTPVPIVLAYLRDGRRAGIAALALSCIVVAALGGWLVSAMLLCCFGLMAVGIAEGLRRQWKPESTVLMGGIPPVAALGLAAASYFARISKNPATAMEAFLQTQRAEAVKLYTGLGLNDIATAISTAVTDTYIHYFVQLLPGLTIAFFVSMAACSYVLSRALIRRKPGIGPVLGALSLAQWHAPDTWVWGLIVTLSLAVLPHHGANVVSWNAAIFFVILYTTQGLGVVEHYLRKAGLTVFARTLVHALILVLPPAITCVVALGVIDIWADFRKLRVSGAEVKP